MKIEENRRDNIGILSISGNLLMEGTAELKHLVRQYVENASIKGLICNLSNVQNIDSAGIGVIVLIFKSLRQSDKRFAVSGLSIKNRELFNLTGLDRVINLAENDEAAYQLLDNQ